MFLRPLGPIALQSFKPSIARLSFRRSIYHQLQSRVLHSSIRNASHFPRPPRGSRFTPEDWHIYRSQNARPVETTVIAAVAVGGGVVFYVTNLDEVPQTGRKRFNCYSEEAVEKQGRMLFKQIMQENGEAILPDWDSRTRQVKRVMNRLIPACGLEHVDWEVYVVNSPEKNAFVIPGGKVFVYAGILPICGSDDGLAAVLGHEIAHNVAQHSAERMSSTVLITPLLWAMHAASQYFDGGFSAQILGRLALDFGITRPASRKQESEADYIGLLMMAQACYNPEAAVGLWQRMQQAETNEIPEWTSTHPSNANRVERIQQWLPKAFEKRKESECGATANYASSFNNTLLQRGFWYP